MKAHALRLLGFTSYWALVGKINNYHVRFLWTHPDAYIMLRQLALRELLFELAKSSVDSQG